MSANRKPVARVLLPPATGDVIHAAGGLLWRRGPRGAEIAVIRRERYGPEWSLPKGKLERGESWLTAATREVREETGCDSVPLDFAGATAYVVGKRPKVVLFWHLRLKRERPFTPSREVQELRWLRPASVIRLLSHPDERALVRQAARRMP